MTPSELSTIQTSIALFAAAIIAVLNNRAVLTAKDLCPLLAWLSFHLRKLLLSIEDPYYTVADIQRTAKRIENLAMLLTNAATDALKDIGHPDCRLLSKYVDTLKAVSTTMTSVTRFASTLNKQQLVALERMFYHFRELNVQISHPHCDEVQFDLSSDRVKKFSKLVVEASPPKIVQQEAASLQRAMTGSTEASGQEHEVNLRPVSLPAHTSFVVDWQLPPDEFKPIAQRCTESDHSIMSWHDDGGALGPFD